MKKFLFTIVSFAGLMLSACGGGQSSSVAPSSKPASSTTLSSQVVSSTKASSEKQSSTTESSEKKSSGETSSVHVHTFAEEWTHDETHHWHTATCGHDVKDAYAEHGWGDWNQTKAPTCTEKGEESRTCSTCGRVEKRPISELGHTYSDIWSSDDVNHWHAATCGHDVKKDEEKHTFDNAGVCTICGKDFSRTILGVEDADDIDFVPVEGGKKIYINFTTLQDYYLYADTYTMQDLEEPMEPGTTPLIKSFKLFKASDLVNEVETELEENEYYHSWSSVNKLEANTKYNLVIELFNSYDSFTLYLDCIFRFEPTINWVGTPKTIKEYDGQPYTIEAETDYGEVSYIYFTEEETLQNPPVEPGKYGVSAYVESTETTSETSIEHYFEILKVDVECKLNEINTVELKMSEINTIKYFGYNLEKDHPYYVYTGASGMYQFTLWDEDMNFINIGIGDPDVFGKEFTVSKSGRYYLRVQKITSSTLAEPWCAICDLRNMDKPFEEIDDNKVKLGKNGANVFKLTINAKVDLMLNASITDSRLCYLYTSDGNPYGGFELVGSLLTLKNIAAGTYYLMVATTEDPIELNFYMICGHNYNPLNVCQVCGHFEGANYSVESGGYLYPGFSEVDETKYFCIKGVEEGKTYHIYEDTDGAFADEFKYTIGTADGTIISSGQKSCVSFISPITGDLYMSVTYIDDTIDDSSMGFTIERMDHSFNQANVCVYCGYFNGEKELLTCDAGSIHFVGDEIGDKMYFKLEPLYENEYYQFMETSDGNASITYKVLLSNGSLECEVEGNEIFCISDETVDYYVCIERVSLEDMDVSFELHHCIPNNIGVCDKCHESFQDEIETYNTCNGIELPIGAKAYYYMDLFTGSEYVFSAMNGLLSEYKVNVYSETEGKDVLLFTNKVSDDDYLDQFMFTTATSSETRERYYFTIENISDSTKDLLFVLSDVCPLSSSSGKVSEDISLGKNYSYVGYFNLSKDTTYTWLSSVDADVLAMLTIIDINNNVIEMDTSGFTTLEAGKYYFIFQNNNAAKDFTFGFNL